MNEEKTPKEKIPSGVVMKEMLQQIIPDGEKGGPVQEGTPSEISINKPRQIPSPESMRTYESDLAKALAQKKTSAVTIAIAENKKKGENESVSTAPARNYIKPLLTGIASLILLGGGVAGGYYLYLKSPLSAPKTVPMPAVIASVIPGDAKINLDISGMTSGQIVSAIYSEFNKNIQPAGKILELVPQENTSPVTGSTFIEKISVNMPDIVLRSLTDRWMLGSYGEESGLQTPFIALTTDFFQNTFAGMLSWEKTMAEDLSFIFNYKKKALEQAEQAENASTSIAAYYNIQGQFSDKQIRNRDAREFRSINGELLFLYSFIDKETLVITTTESAFIAIVDRIEKQTYVR
ncbi:MAG: hypothetical protein Q8Q03_01110 [bacterium]|nr:hypothetical protein [bacterium]